MSLSKILDALPAEVRDSLLTNLDAIQVPENASKEDYFWAVVAAVEKTRKDQVVTDPAVIGLLSKVSKEAVLALTS
jgi:hypothetical protein